MPNYIDKSTRENLKSGGIRKRYHVKQKCLSPDAMQSVDSMIFEKIGELWDWRSLNVHKWAETTDYNCLDIAIMWSNNMVIMYTNLIVYSPFGHIYKISVSLTLFWLIIASSFYITSFVLPEHAYDVGLKSQVSAFFNRYDVFSHFKPNVRR